MPHIARSHRFATTRTFAFLAIVLALASSALAEQPRFEGRTLSQWETDLGDLSPRVRAHAIHALAAFGPAAVPSLVRSLGDSDKSIADLADSKLKDIGPAGIPALAGLQADPNFARALASLWWVLMNTPENSAAFEKALHTMQTLPSTPTVSVLASILRHPDPGVRDSAATTLGMMGPSARSAIPSLEDAFAHDENPLTFSFAIGVIGGREVLSFLLSYLTDLEHAKGIAVVRDQAAASALAAMSAGSRDPLRPSNPINPEFRNSLGPSLAKRVAEVLIRTLVNANSMDAKQSVLVNLVPYSVEPMVRALTKSDQRRRTMLLWIFRRAGADAVMAPDAISELEKLRQSNSPSVRSAANAALQVVKHPSQ